MPAFFPRFPRHGAADLDLTGASRDSDALGMRQALTDRPHAIAFQRARKEQMARDVASIPCRGNHYPIFFVKGTRGKDDPERARLCALGKQMLTARHRWESAVPAGPRKRNR
jgi:hypothetical protein